jgi:hypothetical protein
MNHSERLKICASCKNKVLGKNHETLCRLTQAEPNFEDSCPTYAYKEDNSIESGGGISWRTILSIVLICFGLVRIAVRCNKSNNRERGYSFSDGRYENEMRQAEVERALSDVGVENNNSLPPLRQAEAKQMGLRQLKRDSLVKITKSLSYLIPTGSFANEEDLGNNLPIYYMEPQRYFVSMFRVPAGDSALSEWHLRRLLITTGEYKNTLTERRLEGTNDAFSYTLSNVANVSQGFGKIYTDGKYAYVLSCEHNMKTSAQVKEHFDILSSSAVIMKKQKK